MSSTVSSQLSKDSRQSAVQIIAARLDELGLTQKQFADRIGVSPQHVSQVLKGISAASPEVLESAESVLRLPAGSLSSDRESKRRTVASLSSMPGIEVAYMNVAMNGLRDARTGLLSMTPSDALRWAKGKEDTRFFDAACEQVIVRTLRDFNDHSAIFTEETNFPRGREFAKHICFFIDPFDRSSPFVRLLTQAVKDQVPTVADLMASPKSDIEGLLAPFGSISCLRDGQISFNAMIDYRSGEIYVACSAMMKHGPISKCFDSELLGCYGEDIRFEPRRGLQFTCFLGAKDSPKRPQYEKHLEVLHFPSGRVPPRDLEDPGGPARILFLSDACTTDHKLAFILSNGEKISEWFGWLAYVTHSKELMAFELHADQVSPVRDRTLLAPPPNYSMFQIGDDGVCRVNLDRILILDTPVFYRAAIIIAHRKSLDINNEMSALKSRPLVFGAA